MKAAVDTPPHALSEAPVEQPSGAAPSSARPLILAMLTIIYVLNYLDRQVVVILQEPIKAEFQLKDWQLGLLTGASISILYTAMGIPIARWIDRGVHRVSLIAAITAAWSLMTALCGFSRNFGEFVIARMGVGLGEAGFAPAAHSMLSDLYPLRQRPAAMGIFALGVPLGIMAGLTVGGLVAQFYGWRTALLVAGLPGLVVALAFRLLAREPVRGGSEPDAAAHGVGASMPFREAARALVRRPAYVHVVLAASTAAFASTALFSWLPSFLIRAHGLTIAQAGFGLGILAGVSGLIGTLLGGWQASRFSRYGLQGMIWAPMIGLLVSMPMVILALIYGDGRTTLLMMFVPLTLIGLWTAPSIALTQTLAPVPARATASAIYIVMSNLLGVAMGPLVAGLLSDIFTSWTGDAGAGLRWALIAAAMLFLWSVVHWALAIRALRREATDPGRR